MEIREWRKLALHSIGMLVFVLVISLAVSYAGRQGSVKGTDSSGTETAHDSKTQSLANIEHVEAHSVQKDDIKKLGKRYIEIKKVATGQAVSARLDNDYMTRKLTLRLRGRSVKKYKKDQIKLVYNEKGKTGTLLVNWSKLYHKGDSARYLFRMDHVYETELFETEEAFYIVLRRPSEVYEHVLVVDAGHGGSDKGGGSVGWKYREKEYTLKLVYTLKDILDRTNIKAYYTRLDDREVSKKDRVSLANDVEADAFVSIHCNVSDQTETTARGIETLYSSRRQTTVNGVSSKDLAENILKNVCSLTGRKRRKKIKRDRLYLMHHSKVPVTIVETGYMTNKSDMDYLRKEKNRQRIAEGIYNGVKESLQLP